MTEIALRKISKKYNPGLFKPKVQAVRELDLDVRRGEVLGLIGPNGAGKSTTIRMILGLIRPDTGRVLFRDRPLAESDHLREIGYLPENPYLYDHLNLIELLGFCGRVSGLDHSAVASRREALLDKLGLSGVRKRPLRTFSKGMMQRAAICFALIHDPAVIILDEPMSGLDPIGRKMVFDLISELKGEGKTVFFCSHILSDVERLCDRIGLMVGGRLVNVFEKSQFWQEPGSYIHLLVPPLSPAQRATLAEKIAEIVDEPDGHVLSVPPARLGEATEILAELNVEVIGSRSESVSLEQLFLQNVEEPGQ